MMNFSPCRGCANAETRSKETTFLAVDPCSLDCIELACWQKAVGKASMVGDPQPWQCEICRRPGIDKYCAACRDRVSTELQRRLSIPPPPKIQSGPKQKKINHYKWFYTMKKKSSSVCQICGGAVVPGKPVMCRRCAPSKGNYQHAHVDCLEAAGC